MPTIIIITALWLLGATALIIGLCRMGKRGERD
jgi:hypothetical protein